MTSTLVRGAAGLWLFGVVPVFFRLTAEGVLIFGGGEKDMILVVPLSILARLYSASYSLALKRGMSVLRSVLLAACAAIVLMVIFGFLFRSVVGV